MQIKKIQKRKRRHAAPLGGIFIVLAIFGIITLVVSSIRLTFRVLDNSNDKKMFSDIIRPVVMFNPAPFEDVKDIEMKQLLLYSTWSLLTGPKSSSYVYHSTGELIIPASDLDVACANLFGSEVTLTHQSFGDYETSYHYDPENSVYTITPSAQLYVYSPVVEDIQQVGEYLHLTVGYIAPENAWTTDFSGDNTQAAPSKYMIYVMKKNKDNYQLVKVMDVATSLLPHATE